MNKHGIKKSDIDIAYVQKHFAETLDDIEVNHLRGELKIFFNMTPDEVKDAVEFILYFQLVCPNCGSHEQSRRHSCGIHICQVCASTHNCFVKLHEHYNERVVVPGDHKWK